MLAPTYGSTGVEFTHKEIRIPGDAQLPAICIKTGRRFGLQHCERTLQAISMVTMGLALPVAVGTAVIFLTGGYSHVWRENGWARLSLLLFEFNGWTDSPLVQLPSLCVMVRR